MAVNFDQTFQRLATHYRGKTTQLFLLGMFILLVLRVIMWAVEATYTPGERVEPPKVQIESKLQPDSPVVIKVHELTRPLPEFADSNYFLLGRNNVFDPKQARDRAALERKANEKYTEAYILSSQGRFEDARRSVDEALSLLPGHAKAKELKQQIMHSLGLTTDRTESTTATVQTTRTLSTTTGGVSPSPQTTSSIQMR